MKIGDWYLKKEQAGLVSEGPIWCFYHPGYLYMHEWLLGLLWLVITEWKEDAHLAG